MELQEAIDLVNAIDFKNFPMPIKIMARNDSTEWPTIFVKVSMEVLDINNPSQNITVAIVSEIGLMLPKLEFYRAIKESIRELLTHEIEECFIVGGRMIFNPHEI